MRRGAAVLALAAGIVLGAPALGQTPPDRVVVATADDEFFPRTLTVTPNTTVHWENRGLAHNVKFDDGSFEQPADPMPTPWRVSRHFDDEGTFNYHCETHGGPNGQGMSGTIIVQAGANPVLTNLRVRPRRVCRRKTRRCRKARARIRFTLSEDAVVAGGIDPVGEPAGRRSRDIELKDARQGENAIRIRGRAFAPGRYRVTLAAEDVDGNESDPMTATFRVKRARRRP
jgi:plastocyanin